MITKKELEDAIRECEHGEHDYRTCQKLATFYEMQDHLYGQQPSTERAEETTVGNYGNTEFLEVVTGMEADRVWAVLDELMEALRAINPRLYKAVMRKLTE